MDQGCKVWPALDKQRVVELATTAPNDNNGSTEQTTRARELAVGHTTDTNGDTSHTAADTHETPRALHGGAGEFPDTSRSNGTGHTRSHQQPL